MDDPQLKTTRSVRTTLAAILGLAIVIGWPLVPWILGLSSRDLTDVRGDVVNACAKWLVTLVLCVIAFAIQRWKPWELGICWLGWRDILAALAGVIIALALGSAATRFVVIPASLADFRKIAAVPLGVRIIVLLTAAICEEVISRGFAIEELAYLTGKRWLAGALSLVLFTGAHLRLYGLSAALIIPALVGGILTVLYLWRRNLPSCMLMHVIMDGIFLIVMPALVQAK